MIKTHESASLGEKKKQKKNEATQQKEVNKTRDNKVISNALCKGADLTSENLGHEFKQNNREQYFYITNETIK